MPRIITRELPPAELRRVNLHHLLTRDEIRAVRERSTWRGLAMVVHCWGVIAAMMTLAAWAPNPLTVLLATIVIGSRQLGLAILMHEGAHGGLATNQTWNLRISQVFCAFPILTDTLAYRRYHLEHHAHAQTQKDPDIALSAPFPITRTSMRRKLIRDLTGRTGLKQRLAQLKAAFGKPGEPLTLRLRTLCQRLGRQLLANVVLFGAVALAGRWWLYPLLWLVPLLTWQQAVTRIRNIAEHAALPYADPWQVARTTRANLVERALFAPYHVNYHAEHHLMLYVPCYRLPLLHRLLAAKGAVQRMEVQPSYLAMLRIATSA